MEQRMKDGAMDRQEVEDLLNGAAVGRVSTLGADGWPYTVAVHYLYWEDKVYFHGLPRGEKLSNLLRDPRVCFEVDRLEGILADGVETACQADAAYRSVVLRGEARLVEAPERKREALERLCAKYLPQPLPMGEKAVAGTAVVEIIPKSITGKKHEG